MNCSLVICSGWDPGSSGARATGILKLVIYQTNRFEYLIPDCSGVAREQWDGTFKLKICALNIEPGNLNIGLLEPS